MPEKQRPLNCFLVFLAKRNQQDLAIFLGSLFLVKQLLPSHYLSIISYPTRAHGVIVKYSLAAHADPVAEVPKEPAKIGKPVFC